MSTLEYDATPSECEIDLGEDDGVIDDPNYESSSDSSYVDASAQELTSGSGENSTEGKACGEDCMRKSNMPDCTSLCAACDLGLSALSDDCWICHVRKTPGSGPGKPPCECNADDWGECGEGCTARVVWERALQWPLPAV